uniref:histone deacetylase n=1 Tax=Pyrodinium bahamense TaxID=73915 RepID=A0A7S0BCD1_9DINO
MDAGTGGCARMAAAPCDGVGPCVGLVQEKGSQLPIRFVAALYARLRGLCSLRRAPAFTGQGVPTVGRPGMSPEQAPCSASSGSSGPSSSALVRIQAAREWLEANSLLNVAEFPIGLVYDEVLQLHTGPSGHPERPVRTKEILSQLDAAGLLQACAKLPSREATEEELLRVHDERHIERVLRYEAGGRKKAKPYTFPFGPDTYVCEHTPQCARLAAGCLLSLVDTVLDDVSPVRSGMAVVRPPGHHATADRASGFCLFNNVAVAARHLQRHHGLERVAIVDWDVHHGNGTNDLFAEDPTVLFFSMHRHDTQGFFPGTGFLEDAGKGAARGYTVNVPLEKGYTDVDIVHVVRYIVCPLIERFQPQAILVSAGFDAAKGDPLGECRLSPEAFGWMTRCLYRLARSYCNDRLFLVLEGGYNPDAIAQCCLECVQSMIAEASGVHRPCVQVAPAATSPAASAPPSAPSSAPSSAPGTPSLSPARSLAFNSAMPLSTLDLTPVSSPKLPPASPTHAASVGGQLKVRGPSSKTVRTVRQLTEIHNLLPLELPLAPKQLEGSGAVSKNARKSERRRLRDAAREDASSDSSGWAIACGQSDAEPTSPYRYPVDLVRQESPASSVPGLSELELPPALPSPRGREGRGEPAGAGDSRPGSRSSSRLSSPASAPSAPAPQPRARRRVKR